MDVFINNQFLIGANVCIYTAIHVILIHVHDFGVLLVSFRGKTKNEFSI